MRRTVGEDCPGFGWTSREGSSVSLLDDLALKLRMWDCDFSFFTAGIRRHIEHLLDLRQSGLVLVRNGPLNVCFFHNH